MLPDGSYRMSQAQVAEAVDLSRRNVSDFLRSKAIKALLGEGYTGTILDLQPKLIDCNNLPEAIASQTKNKKQKAPFQNRKEALV